MNLIIREQFARMDVRWRHPWTCIVAGPSSSGKSVFTRCFVKNIDKMSDTKFNRIIVYFAEWQPGYRKYGENVEFIEGLPQQSHFAGDDKPKLIIIDDLMRESSNSTICDLFTKGSHHKNLSVLFITQNLFHQGRGQRDISLNTSYLILFKNPRDRAQIQHLARQLYPENPKYVQEAFMDATSKPHGYLFIDLKQSTPDNCRIRTNIFPFDTHQYVYVPKLQANKYGDSRSQVPVVHL